MGECQDVVLSTMRSSFLRGDGGVLLFVSTVCSVDRVSSGLFFQWLSGHWFDIVHTWRLVWCSCVILCPSSCICVGLVTALLASQLLYMMLCVMLCWFFLSSHISNWWFVAHLTNLMEYREAVEQRINPEFKGPLMTASYQHKWVMCSCVKCITLVVMLIAYCVEDGFGGFS